MVSQDLIRIDGLVIDPDTGEVVEWPDGWAGDRIEHLLAAYHEAALNLDGWQARIGQLKAALGRQLEDRDLRSLSTALGTVRWVAPVPSLRPLGVKELREVVVERYGFEEGAALLADLVREQATRPYVRVDKPAAPAPAIERVQREEEAS